MIKNKDIVWLSGLLEGEGCFDLKQDKNANYSYPRISITMTSKDVIEKVTRLFNSPLYRKEFKNRNTIFITHITGIKAVQWMMTLYTLMGNRRKKKILECLNVWKITKYPRYGKSYV